MTPDDPGVAGRVCPSCTAPMATPFCSTCGAATVPVVVATCPTCGGQPSPSARFCSVCGTDLTPARPPAPPAVLVVLGVALLVVALGLLGSQVLLAYADELPDGSWIGLATGWWEVNQGSLNPRGSVSALLQVGLTAAAGISVLVQRRLTPLVFVALPVAVLSFQALTILTVVSDDPGNWALGVWLPVVGGLAALVVVAMVAVAWWRIWSGLGVDPAVLVTGVIAALFAAVVFFVNFITYRLPNGEAIDDLGLRWYPSYNQNADNVLFTLVMLVAAVGLPLLAALVADRRVGFFLSLGTTAALLAYYVGWIQTVRQDQDVLSLNGASALVVLALVASVVLNVLLGLRARGDDRPQVSGAPAGS